jgi:hypothetical protein
MTALREDEIAWDDLPIEERLRDCFAEAETAMEEVSALLGSESDPVATALTDLARHVQTIAGRMRSLFDQLIQEHSGEEA